MDNHFLLIPVKAIGLGKSRLAGGLPRERREALNRFLLENTLLRASFYPGAAYTIVVTNSAEVIALAKSRGMHTVEETRPHLGLNHALEEGTRHAVRLGGRGLCVVPVDLPFGDPFELSDLLQRASSENVCVLVPDHTGDGTNLLYQRPIRIADYEFGPGSLVRHRIKARLRGFQVVVEAKSVFAFDIDTVSDLRTWRARAGLQGQLSPHLE